MTSNAPSVEAITEFTVDTNGFKAEYGHAGGGVMTFVTKSGTNQFHGSAYEFLRNNDFDANDWFSNRAGKARQIYKQNDFGATVGGPSWISRSSFTARTRASSSSPTKDSVIATARPMFRPPSPRPKCTTAISVSG